MKANVTVDLAYDQSKLVQTVKGMLINIYSEVYN